MDPQSGKPGIDIRPFRSTDWRCTWRILEPVFRAGRTYPYSPRITEDEAHQCWIEGPAETFVAVDGDDGIVGTYYIKPNQPGLGAHVCNCGYVVAEHVCGRGIGAAMCAHSLTQAKEMGFRAMQYNLVVSTNERALRLWARMGFAVVGTLPGAFRHPDLGFVDAYVMYRQLDN